MKSQSSHSGLDSLGKSVSNFAYEDVMSMDGTEEFLADYFERKFKNTGKQNQ